MVFFSFGHLVDQNHHDAVVVLIEDRTGDHHTVACLNAHIAIG